MVHHAAAVWPAAQAARPGAPGGVVLLSCVEDNGSWAPGVHENKRVPALCQRPD